MPLVNDYPEGAPCWFELATPNQDGAKRFYSELLGWTIFDAPMGPGEFYTMFKLKDRDVAAAYKIGPQMEGVPPHWAVYFSVASADETAVKVTQSGGSVIKEPFDVMEVGRMAVCKDPGDAVFYLWQSKMHKGVGISNENNTVGWVELATWDTAKARDFYSKVFGWATKNNSNMPTYVEFMTGDEPRGGLLPMDDAWKGIPSHWGIYFVVADIDAFANRAKELGGAVRFGPFDAPGVGRLAAMADAQGVGFSAVQLEKPMA